MILNIRLDHKTSDVKTMETASDRIEEIVGELEALGTVTEKVPLRTCNRVEYYLHVTGVPPEFDFNGFTVEKDEEALLHILRLASGLESMIIGEDQILGQIKAARLQALREGTCGPLLDMVFTKAVHVGQTVRRKTKINRGSVSIGSAAVDLAESIHGDLKCKKVLVIGAGKMGTLVARALAEKHLKAIMVANRTYERAYHLACELGGDAIHFDRLNRALRDADVVISATGSPHYILTRERVMESIPPERRSRIVMIDIANPRDIEESVRELGVRLFTIDDLRGVAEENRKRREAEAREAEAIVRAELELLLRTMKHREVEPLLAEIRGRMESLRQREAAKAIKKIENSGDPESVVEGLTRSIVDKIFHDIALKIRDAAERDDKEFLRMCSELFDCEEF
ncbi:glutamyl-tRNA reductase [Methanothermobacter sp.]|uniref:glutamyl-tRNA reductase n=1 Tax=Methanothermobacter sp. TaxID=1884223 RepID=UPI0026047F4C|nr:glutamyl-tRNA reductase [Methanothermobacter sp.]MDI9619065.1 glutamyl-tRNA reductase [Methanothermobacter sp.]